MASCRILVLSVVLVILCSVQCSLQCANENRNDPNRKLIANNRILERAVDNGGSDYSPEEYEDDPDNEDEEPDGDDEEPDGDEDELNSRWNKMKFQNIENNQDLDGEPEEPEGEEEEELDVEELAEGEFELETHEQPPVARYDGAQLWRINTGNVSNDEVVKLFQSRYDGSVWKAKDDYVDVFLEESKLLDAQRALKGFDLPYEVQIENVQSMIDSEKHQMIRANKNRLVKRQAQGQRQQMTWDSYYDLADIYGYMRTLTQKFPNLCKLVNIGKTVEGRGILLMKVSGPKSTRTVWVDGGIHAREWISVSSVMYIMDQFVRYWAKQPAHIRSATWYFLPVINPDGYQFSRTTDRLWRKNRRNFGSCHGVDLNRNFDFKWTGVGASNNPCDMTYRGAQGLSEPESRAVAQYLQNLPRKPSAYITIHSYGQYILYPWGFASAIPSDHRVLKQTGLDAAASARLIDGALYTVAPAFQPFGAAAGGSDDWAKGHLKVKYVYTVELRDKGRYGFLLPTELIRVTCREALTIIGVISKASVTAPVVG